MRNEKQKLILRSIVILVFVVAFGLFSGCDFTKLIAGKELLGLLVGTLFLSATNYKRGMKMYELLGYYRSSVLLMGMLMTFLSLFERMSRCNELQMLSQEMALSLRTLLYALCIYIMIPEHLNHKEKQECKINPEEKNLPGQAENPVVALAQIRENYQLTAREAEIVELIYQNKSNHEIAELLFISEATVKKHTNHIYHKTGVENREGLIRLIFGVSKSIDFEPKNICR